MATYYINADSGDDSTGDGSSGSPWETFAHAYDNSSVDDTIVCQDSDATYAWTSKDMTTGRTVEATEFGDAVFDAGGAAIYWKLQGDWTFTNLEFQNAQDGDSYLGIFTTNPGGTGGTRDWVRCSFHDMVVKEDSAGYGGVFQNYVIATDNNFTGCIFYNITERAGTGNAGKIFAAQSTGSSGTYTLTNCTVVITETTNTLHYVFSGSYHCPYVVVKNSIFYNSSGGAVKFIEGHEAGRYSGTYSCFYSVTSPPSGTGNITSDPQMIDPDNDDFRLRPTSPCIDTGTIV
jgi:hypothetical protein